MNLEQLVYMPAWAMQYGTGYTVGNQIGAGNVALAKQYGKVG
jgi:Na+-driven multidrug efflux pump